MGKTKAYTLFSGSKGNCTYIKYGKTELLIDAGVCESKIEKALNALGSSLGNISDIFITHDHSDHTRGLEIICKKHDIRVHMTERSADVVLDSYKCSNLYEKTVVHPIEFSETVGEIEISSFATPHDSAASVEYIILTPEIKFGYATDIGCITDIVREKLCGVSAVILESNHDVSMLKESVYPDFLKRRILSRIGHLSNDDCAEFAAYLAENGTKKFLLAHLSEENNLPELAFSTTLCALGNIESRGISLAIASPNCPTQIL